jgi:hypothetical protein
MQLDQFLNALRGKRAEFTLEDLYDELQPPSREDLILALGDFVRRGKLKRVIRVVSPKTQGGIGDYDSLDKVPQFAHDRLTDTQIEVTPDDLKVFYVVPA